MSKGDAFKKFTQKKMQLAAGELVLREFTRKDVPAFNAILNEPAVNKFLLATPPVTMESTLKHYREVSRDKLVKWVGVLLDGKLAGAIEWRRGRLKRSHVAGFNIVFSTRAQGTGAAGAAMRACLPYLRTNGVEVISENCFADNSRARAFYNKLGFREVAVLKKRFKRGRAYVDEIIFEKFI